jgi:hypothetical protein
MSVIRVESGPPDAQTDPTNGMRTYRWRGRELPSVTTILRLAGLPEGLHNWALGQVVDRSIAQAQAITDRLRDVAPGNRGAIVSQIRAELLQAPNAQRDRSAALGTALHRAVASPGSHAGLDPDVQSRLRQYGDWLRVSGAEVLASEFQVWNLSLGYAGSADLLVRLRDGSLWLVDIKTGRSVHPEHALQLAGYGIAEFVGAHGEIDDGLSDLLLGTQNLAVLHLTPQGWEFRSIPFTVEIRDTFVCLVRYVAWSQRGAERALVSGARRSGSAPPGTP